MTEPNTPREQTALPDAVTREQAHDALVALLGIEPAGLGITSVTIAWGSGRMLQRDDVPEHPSVTIEQRRGLRHAVTTIPLIHTP